MIKRFRSLFSFKITHRICFAAKLTRCQTVLSNHINWAASFTPTFTLAFGFHIFKKRCFCDTKRRVFDWVRVVVLTLPISRISRHIFNIVHLKCSLVHVGHYARWSCRQSSSINWYLIPSYSDTKNEKHIFANIVGNRIPIIWRVETFN